MMQTKKIPDTSGFLKISLLILKMKPSLNIAKESMPLMLFDHVA